jgi:NADH:ubiquinone oxidoreductase subunit E
MMEQSDMAGTVAEVGGFYGSTLPAAPGDMGAEALALMDRYLAEHPGGPERLIPLLHWLQAHLGYLPLPVQAAVAERLALAPVQVAGVVSFYNYFTTVPRGRYQVKVCMGTACFVRGSERLLDTLADLLHAKVGGISEDGIFNLEQVRCIGACGLAPAIMVNDAVHGNLTLTKLRRLVQKLRAKARAEATTRVRTEEVGS